MSAPPSFRADLYRGTASFYDRYRLPYPAALIDDLCRRVAANGSGRLLDLACGPGTATFPLHDRFSEVWAVDLEPETVAFAARRAEALGVRNVRWSVGRAEDVDANEVFDVVTIGTAFHRLDRARVARLATGWLRPGGHLALLWSSQPLNGPAPWQATFADVVVEWIERMHASDRLPSDFAAHLEALPHEAVLEGAGFELAGRYEFSGVHDWTPAELVGFVYSTSLLPRPVLGDRAAAFEADVEHRVGALAVEGVLREETSFAYDLALRPPGLPSPA